MLRGILSIIVALIEQNVGQKQTHCNLFNLYLNRQLPALGHCLATLAGAMPVAFLEPKLNTYNPCSVFNTKSVRDRAGDLSYLKYFSF